MSPIHPSGIYASISVLNCSYFDMNYVTKAFDGWDTTVIHTANDDAVMFIDGDDLYF